MFRTRLYLCAFLVAAAACEGKFSHRIEERLQGEIPLPEGLRGIRVELLDGDVTFQAGEPGRVSFDGAGLKAADSAEQLELLERESMGLREVGVEDGVMRLRGPELPAGADQGKVSVALRLIVSVPPEVALDVQSRSGTLAAMNMRAPVTLRIQRGMLNLSKQRGKGVLRTGSGDVIVDGHRGGLDVETGAGKLFAWVDELGQSGVQLVTKDGPIQARLPDDASFRLDARAEMGKAANEYGVPVERNGEISTMSGQVGNGGPDVVLRAAQGRISLRRANQSVQNPLPVLLIGLAGVLVLAVALILYRRSTTLRAAM